MADYAINIVLKARDEATPVIRGLIGETRGLRNQAFGRAGARAGQRAAANPQAQFGRFASGLSMAATGMQQLTHQARAAISAPLQLSANFEQAMAEVRGVTSDAQIGSNFEDLSATARQLGRSTEFTAQQVAQGLKYMGVAGFSSAQQIAGIAPLLDIATFSGMKLGKTSDLVTDVMGSFGFAAGQMINGVEATRYAADVMVMTSKNANTNVAQLARGMFKVGPLASQLGISIEEVAATLGTLANSGIKGAQGGTAVRNMLLSLTGKPTAEMRKLLKVLGVDGDKLRKTLGQEGLAAGMRVLMAQISKLTPEMQLFAANVLFNRRTAAPAMKIMQELGTGYADLYRKAQQAGGSSAKAAEAFRDTANVAGQRLRSALDDLGITIGNELMPVLLPMVRDAQDMVRSFATWAKENPNLVRSLGSIVLKLALFGTVITPILTSATALVSVGRGVAAIMTLLSGRTAIAAVTQKTVSGAMKASRVATLGWLGAAALAGYALGTMIDKWFGISDAIARAGLEADLFNERLTRSSVRGAASLKDLSAAEQARLQSIRAERERLFNELENLAWYEDDDEIKARLNELQAQADTINAEGIKRGEQRKRAAAGRGEAPTVTDAQRRATAAAEQRLAQLEQLQGEIVVRTEEGRVVGVEANGRGVDMRVDQGVAGVP